MTTRRVKTEEERAREELALAGRKRRRAQQRYDAANAAKLEAEEALRLAAAVEEHAAAHPVLRSDEPPELQAEELLPVPIDGPGSDEPAELTA